MINKYYKLSLIRYLPLNIIQDNINENWNWGYLSFNKNLTFEFIEKNKNKPWNFEIAYRFALDNCVSKDFEIYKNLINECYEISYKEYHSEIKKYFSSSEYLEIEYLINNNNFKI